ncbi:MAG: PD-(D/E)XK nuclease domain-containing protein [Deltaproteobacteria bacterium]|jgi:3'-phosphoadenosine 5'-phosphosulfate (PAPS) 3'-phosphatase|nr:PD-(D/E)XK nuclease domain-containing protein [Deltaproteobacteria bacterium]
MANWCSLKKNRELRIIEMKHVQMKEKGRPLTEEKIRLKKEEAVKEAMDQIEKQKYALKFQSRGNKIYKTALVAAGRSDVLAVFEEAQNWTLELDPSENFYGVPEI